MRQGVPFTYKEALRRGKVRRKFDPNESSPRFCGHPKQQNGTPLILEMVGLRKRARRNGIEGSHGHGSAASRNLLQRDL